MPLPSFFKRKPPDADRRPSAPDDGSAVEQARTRARRRLIGAVVLLAAGVIGFPLIFETQPRPVSADIPIETPGRSAVAPQPAPAPPPRAVRGAVPPPPPVVAEAPAEAPSEPAPAASAPKVVAVAPAPASQVVAKVDKAEKAEKAPEKPPEKATKPDKPASKADDGTRAKALLEAAASQPKAAVRFVVQVGAYTDSAAVRDARAKVEKLGLTSYTQVIESDTGRRTRVRVGPFASREEADSAGARLKGAGLPVHILQL